MGEALDRLAGRLRRRIVFRHGIEGACNGLLVGCLVGLALTIADRLIPALPDAATANRLVFPLSVLLALLVLLLHLRGRLEARTLLALADRAVSSGEALLTACDAPEGEFGRIVSRKAALLAGRVEPSRVVPLAIPRHGISAMLSLIAFLLLTLVPKWVSAEQLERLQESKRIESAAEKLKEDLAALEPDEREPPSPEVERALAKAQRLADQLEHGKLGPMEALAELGQTEAAVDRERTQAGFAPVRDAFERAAPHFSGTGMTNDLAHALSQADAEAIARSMRELAKKMSAPEELGATSLDRMADAFQRLSSMLDREGEKALARKAAAIAGSLAGHDSSAAADKLRQLASERRMTELARQPDKARMMSRSLDTTSEMKEVVESLDRADAAAVRRSIEDLALRLKHGSKPISFEEGERKRLAEALKKLGHELESTRLRKVGRQLTKAGRELASGKANACAATLKGIEALFSGREANAQGSGQGGAKGLAASDARLAELKRLLAETRSLLGGEQPVLNACKGRTPVDYGVGTSKDEEMGGRSDNVHHSADRTGDARSDWTEKYEAKYESLRLKGARGASTMVKAADSEASDFIEFRGPGTKNEPRAPMAAPPQGYKKAAEDALDREAIPPRYRDQVKRYFDESP